ncbi:MAG: mechanosensitive ion channel family protein [Dehalococcoidales bacterium]|nr:mechanosensitive ion channel family protein [Dehalococcoidales bacterium]
MNWEQLTNTETLFGLVLPVGIALVIIIVMLLLRKVLYSYIRRLASKTRTDFDDILIHDTRPATFLWSIWLGLFTGFAIYDAPDSWSAITDKAVPVIFTALGIYTAIMVAIALLRWYKKEICCRTTSSLDDIILRTLIIATPVIGGGLGIITILNMLGKGSDLVNNWLNTLMASLGAITLVTVILLLLSVVVVPRFINSAVRNSSAEQTEEDLQKRASTLISVVGTAIQVMILFIYLLMIASNAGLDITSVLAGAGVLGIAIGFGAQSLVKDVLAGLFIIMENQYRKGDVVSVAGESGVVEEINLRRTILRNLDGIYHVVPNGEIRIASNYTKQWARANINVAVTYGTDLKKAMEVIDGVGKEMAGDSYWSCAFISPPKAIRVDNLGVNSGIEIKVMADTKPARQWEVMGELRLRIKNAFDKEGIVLYYPHTRVFLDNPSSQLKPGAETAKIEDDSSARKLNN